MDAVTFSDYTFWYPEEEKPALCNIQWSVKAGEFIVLCGKTGSGKSTMLRQIKQEISPAGRTEGELLLFGRPAGREDPRVSAAQVGFVMQNPENQLVMDTVWHELAFGLENLGTPRDVICRRVAETAHFFGAGAWFQKKVSELSGGQKQMLNLAAVVAMQPKILVLDEPTAQLDPIAAKEFLQMLGRINRELGVTVILCEHRLEDVFPLADRVVFMENGKIEWTGEKAAFLEYIFHEKPEFTTALPTAAQLACQLETEETYPQTIREGRRFVEKHLTHLRAVPRMPVGEKRAVVLHAQELWFRYEKHEEFVLRGADLTLCEGEIHALVGGNGSGKSTLLQLLAGVYPPAKGKIKKSADKRSAVLAQNPKALFLRDTVEEDLMEWASRFSYTKNEVREMMEYLGLSAVADRHPYDLSGGEMQKAALAKILLLKPDLLLLDEPAKGLDAGAKEQFQKILADLKNEGKAILLVTHDLELAAKIADRCSMMFRGEITCTSEGKSFFLDNVFYTTGVNRMTRGYLEGCVVKEDIAYVK